MADLLEAITHAVIRVDINELCVVADAVDGFDDIPRSHGVIHVLIHGYASFIQGATHGRRDDSY